MKNTVNLFLTKRGEEQSQTQYAFQESWILRREIPLHLSEDGNARLTILENEPELVIQGDVRMELVVTGSMTSVLAFVRFHTRYVYQSLSYIAS